MDHPQERDMPLLGLTGWEHGGLVPGEGSWLGEGQVWCRGAWEEGNMNQVA